MILAAVLLVIGLVLGLVGLILKDIFKIICIVLKYVLLGFAIYLMFKYGFPVIAIISLVFVALLALDALLSSKALKDTILVVTNLALIGVCVYLVLNILHVI